MLTAMLTFRNIIFEPWGIRLLESVLTDWHVSLRRPFFSAELVDQCALFDVLQIARWDVMLS